MGCILSKESTKGRALEEWTAKNVEDFLSQHPSLHPYATRQLKALLTSHGLLRVN